MIDEKNFLRIIEATPLVSVDLIIKNNAGKILLGKRINRPAQNYWFVPGGRIRKNEKIAEAFERISSTELDISLSLLDAQLLGAFDHIYDDNYLGVKEINTHYVVLAYNVTIPDDLVVVIDEQHSKIKWWTVENLLDSADVHPNTKAYF